MIQSMTGFGRGEAANEKYKVTIEMKSVNHRYLDLSVRLPRKLNFYEPAIRNQVKEFAKRGKIVTQALRAAGEKFTESRRIEGEKLAKDLSEKLDHISDLVDKIEVRSPQIVEEYRKKITEKVEQLLGDTQIDENLLATEIVMFSDKICVDEEMVRLRTHVEHVKETLAAGENIGRKLDFLIQEMNREANTTLSKANDSEVSEYGIDLKTEIEKIREQIQNIE